MKCQETKEKVKLSKGGEQPGFMGLGTFEVDVYYNEIKKDDKYKIKISKGRQTT